MLALVEGRHATGENVFHVMQMMSGDAKSDDEVNKVKCDSPGIMRNNSFSFEIDEGPESIEQPFSDWVCPQSCSFPYIKSNKMLYRVLVPLHHLERSP